MFWRKRPTGTRIVLADIGPPTWNEQQRLMGAMLAYHLARKLKFAGNNGTLRVSASPWTAKFFNDMIKNNYSFLSLGKFWQIGYAIKRETTLLQQIRYPTYFVEGMCLAFIQWLFNCGSPDTGTSAMATPRPSLIPLSEQELQLPDDPFMVRGILERISALGLGVIPLFGRPFSGKTFPNGFRPFFRRFGFHFWDERRMVALGFMAPAEERSTRYPGSPPPDDEPMWCRWMSVLSQEQFDEWMHSSADRFDNFVNGMI